LTAKQRAILEEIFKKQMEADAQDYHNERFREWDHATDRNVVDVPPAPSYEEAKRAALARMALTKAEVEIIRAHPELAQLSENELKAFFEQRKRELESKGRL